MAATCVNTTLRRDKDNRSHEYEALFEAIKNCDADTYLAIISILEEAGLLPV
jgi:hypothetical protein